MNSTDETSILNLTNVDPGKSILVFSVQWVEYMQDFTLVLFLYSIALLLLFFKESPIRKLTDKIPESCLLILLGVAIGAVVYVTQFNSVLKSITARCFFDFLLPPIVLNASYQLYCKQLLFQLDAVLILAVFGTAFNVFCIGFSLYGVYGQHNGIGVLDCLLFGSIVAAVDPVAVLAVFNQIGVSRWLYIVIFGESLFNDAVTVVFFESLEKLSHSPDGVVDQSAYLFALLSFFLVSLGGWTIGFAYGILSAIACKYTSLNSRILEPMIILLSAYLAFLSAQIVHWSGFIALIACGITQKRYAFPNLFEKSRMTILEGMETIAVVSETAIFLILGVASFVDSGWSYQFILWTLLFCIIYRFVCIYTFGSLMNLYRLQHITYKHMFVMSYGGLRGAVSYALAAATKKNAALFLTTTMAVILFTVFFQGATVRWIVVTLNFQERSSKRTFTALVLERISFHSVAGMESMLGGAGTRLHYGLERLEQCDKKYLRKCLTVESKDLSGMTDLLYHREIHRIYRIHNSKKAGSNGDSPTVHVSNDPEINPSLPRPSLQFSLPLRQKSEKARDLNDYKNKTTSDDFRAFKSHRRSRNKSVLTDGEKFKRGSIRKLMLHLQFQNASEISSITPSLRDSEPSQTVLPR